MAANVTIITTIKEGEERSEDPDVQWKGKHKVYYNTKEKQYMKTANQHKTLNKGKTKLGGYPSGRLHPLVGYTLW